MALNQIDFEMYMAIVVFLIGAVLVIGYVIFKDLDDDRGTFLMLTGTAVILVWFIAVFSLLFIMLFGDGACVCLPGG